MRRRDFIIGVIAGSLTTWPLAAYAQQVRRIGILMNFTAKALGLKVPLHVQQLADEVIE